MHRLSLAASHPENDAARERHLINVRKHADRVFGTNLLDSDVAEKEQNIGLKQRLLWLQTQLIKRLVTTKSEDEVIEKQKILITLLEALDATMTDEIVLPNCLANETINQFVIQKILHEVSSRQRLLHARASFEKGDFQAVVDDLEPLARDESISETVAVKKTEAYELLSLRRSALKKLPADQTSTDVVSEQLLCIFAQIRLINNELELFVRDLLAKRSNFATRCLPIAHRFSSLSLLWRTLPSSSMKLS